eukprot:sb/3467051/
MSHGLRPDSHLLTFFASPPSTSSDTEVSFTGMSDFNTSIQSNSSLDNCMKSIHEKLTHYIVCIECLEQIFFAEYDSCEACNEPMHVQCVPSEPRTSTELAVIPEPCKTMCSQCIPANPPPPELPAFCQANCWGELNAEELYQKFNTLAPTISTWSPNLFMVPFGTVGRAFIDELTRLGNLFANSPAAECYALSALTLAPSLMLQKPSKKSKNAEHKELLERRLKMWKNGQFDELFKEAKAIQKPLKPRPPSKELCENKFISLMREGRTTEATNWLDPSRHDLGVKQITPEVLADLEEKHPPFCVSKQQIRPD